MQTTFLMSLTDLIIDDIKCSQGYSSAIEAVKKCWDWIKYKSVCADDLYDYLENIEDTGVLTYLSLEKDPHREKVWICIGNSLAYTIWAAYKYENQKHRPQTIECVDNETIISFIETFKIVYDPQIVALLLGYLSSSDSETEYEDIMQFIKNNVQ